MANKTAKATSLGEIVGQARSWGASPAQARRVHTIVKKHRFPRTVRSFQLKFGQDSTSDPAMWITFLVDDDLNPSSKKIKELTKFANEVQSNLVKQNLSFWPYVGFRAIPNGAIR